MRRSKIHRMTALIMAFFMLLSSTGFSIDLHYCKGQLKSFSFIGKAKSCCAQKSKAHCSKMKQLPVETPAEDGCQKDCCENKTIEVLAEDDLAKIPSPQLSKLQTEFISAFAKVYFLDHSDQIKDLVVPHQKYIPPLLDKDLPVLIQSFLL